MCYPVMKFLWICVFVDLFKRDCFYNFAALRFTVMTESPGARHCERGTPTVPESLGRSETIATHLGSPRGEGNAL